MATFIDGKAVYHSQAEEYRSDLSDESVNDPDVGKSMEERARLDKQLVRKIDLWLIPWLCLIYLLSFLDRTNIGNARLVSLEKDLGIEGFDYNITLIIFFVSYAGAEPITNLILKRLSPRVFFTAIMLLWGLMMMCMGFVHNMASLLAVRFLLGLAEAGLFPGVSYYISCWYKRSELGLRISIFFSAAALAGAFGGLLAAAIALMADLGSLSGWAWIFIIEGLATVFVGCFCWWMVFDWPQTARFLTAEERQRVMYRLAIDKQGSAGTEDYHKLHVMAALKDWKTYSYAVISMGFYVPLYSFSLFLPTILAGMSHKGTRAQLLTVPPYAVAAVLTVAVGWFADRTKWRGYCNITIPLFGIAGFSMLLATTDPHIQYAGTFLGAMGIYPCVANSLAWVANNVEGTYKRGVVIGIVVGWGNLNGIVSSSIYTTEQKPRYRIGHGVVLGYLTICLLGGSVFTHLMLRAENDRRKSGARDNMLAGKSAEEVWAAGDKRPDFYYTL